MKRKTKNARLALERLAERLGVVVWKQQGRRYVAELPDGSPRWGSAKELLGALVFMALHTQVGDGLFEEGPLSLEDVRDTIRLTEITPRGIPAHRHELLRKVLS